MLWSHLFGLLTAIVALAGVTVLVSSGNTKDDINALTGGFANSIKSATLH